MAGPPQPPARTAEPPAACGLAPKVGLFDATMLVMGGIVGAGIFINPYVVARLVPSSGWILAAWAVGGGIALLGAFVYAELAARMPEAGGQYAYLREAFHPALAFLYGWVLLLVIQTGGMAAVAVTFAAYFLELTGLALSASAVAALALGALALVNCFGVRAGSSVQSALMVLKILAILALVAGAGWFLLGDGGAGTTGAPAAVAEGTVARGAGAGGAIQPALTPSDPAGPSAWLLLGALATAMVPVLFAYGGWQTANFVAEEVREPRRNLPRALVVGVAGVVALYLAVNWVCVEVLGPEGLAATTTPASAVMERALGRAGARWIAVGIAVSTLGFLSQSILTAPRVYFAMARDGLFFRSVGRLTRRTRVPAVAILLQGAMAIVIALSGRYDQILSYVVAMDFLFFGLTACCLFVFRTRERRDGGPGAAPGARVPGHPVTTALFVAAAFLVVANTLVRYPVNTGIGLAILAAGIPVYLLWSRRTSRS